jgi:hypothetical protein
MTAQLSLTSRMALGVESIHVAHAHEEEIWKRERAAAVTDDAVDEDETQVLVFLIPVSDDDRETIRTTNSFVSAGRLETSRRPTTSWVLDSASLYPSPAEFKPWRDHSLERPIVRLSACARRTCGSSQY